MFRSARKNVHSAVGGSKIQSIAWDDLTTPLAENSGETAPSIALARSLGGEKQIDLADRAWATAFQVKSTNPEIRLEHAQLLQGKVRPQSATALLKRVTDSNRSHDS